MKIEKFSLGILGANCYLLINEETKDTVVVDPGGHSKKFTAYIEEEKLNLVAILLTHGHFDHIMGIDSILENWNIPVYVEEEDLPIMTDPELNLSSSYTNGYSFDGAKPLKDGQKLELAGETIEVILSPPVHMDCEASHTLSLSHPYVPDKQSYHPEVRTVVLLQNVRLHPDCCSGNPYVRQNAGIKYLH